MPMASNFLKGKKHIIIYGISLAILLVLLNWLKLRLVIIDHAFEVYNGAIALIFTGIGIWVALKLAKPKEKIVVIEKEVMVEKNVGFTMNETELNRLNLSKRELEVLQLMAQGLSNQEIADRLFLSLSTVKTHANNLFDKMGVERRTQAINQAKQLGIIP
ncbi:winged helix-turn-helix transcriptional regulator [Fulvivirgaceae bacterium PWU4]|uniref:Winged helix-turn-helix transcriptional regulator n=2 Tax=Chryseosolibacter histidini TaxID=2782349 RepID=A0AAP2DRH0_9BACT|nr:winged helix-turn-helix transcriptional regulator [Chryseosolibacter histidini]